MGIKGRVQEHRAFVLPAGSKPVRSPKGRQDGAVRLRKWQREAFKEIGEAQWGIIVAPMGSGKSTLLRAFGCVFLNRGYKVIVAVPQALIAQSFRCLKLLLPDGSVQTWNPENFIIEEKDSIGKIVQFVREPAAPHLPGRVLVCTHQAIVQAHARLMEAHKGRSSPWKGVALFLDETHHSCFHDGVDDGTRNRLGQLVEHWTEKKVGPLRLATATWMRSDDMDIIPEDARRKFVRYALPMDRYLESMEHLKEVHFRYIIGSPVDSVRHLFRESACRTIVHLPPVNSTLMVGMSKLDVLASYERAVGVKAASPSKHLRAYRVGTKTVTGLDLVNEDGRDARKTYLHSAMITGKGLPDITWALRMGMEGHNDPSLERGVMMGARGSIPMVIQTFGRLLRDYPGKSTVQFNMVLPYEGKEDPKQLRDYLKVMLASMVVEWHFAPVTIKCGPKGRKAIERVRADMDEFVRIIEETTEQAILRDGSGETTEEIVASALEGFNFDEEEKSAVTKHISSLFSSKSRSIMAKADDVPFDPNLAKDAFGCVRVYAMSFGFNDLSQLRRALGAQIPWSLPYIKQKMVEHRDANITKLKRGRGQINARGGLKERIDAAR